MPASLSNNCTIALSTEDDLLDQQVPPRGFLALLRKQLIVMRRYMAPQRDVYARLASERLPWMSDDQRRRMQDIAERLGRGLDEIDSCIARTAIASDEIAQIMQESLARRTYTMSLMAMVFLPAPFNRPVRRQPRRDPATAGIWGLAYSA